MGGIWTRDLSHRSLVCYPLHHQVLLRNDKFFGTIYSFHYLIQYQNCASNTYISLDFAILLSKFIWKSMLLFIFEISYFTISILTFFSFSWSINPDNCASSFQSATLGKGCVISFRNVPKIVYKWAIADSWVQSINALSWVKFPVSI